MQDSRVDTARERASIGAADGGQHGRKTFLARFAVRRVLGLDCSEIFSSPFRRPLISYLFIHAIFQIFRFQLINSISNFIQNTFIYSFFITS